MTLEIIIATKDRPNDLKIALESVLTQSTLPHHILIIDSGTQKIDSSILEKQFLSKNISFKKIESKSGLTYQRNVGISNSTGDIILFIDDDVVLEPDYIKNILKAFHENNKAGGVTGRITNGQYNPGFFAKTVRKLFYLPLPGTGEILPSGLANSVAFSANKQKKIEWLSGCNMAYRREVFDWNWFDENLKEYSYAEDLDFSCRVGKNWELVFEPSARLEHRPAASNRLNEEKKYAMLARNHAYLFRKNKPGNSPSQFAFHWSLIGILIQTLFLQKTFSGFKGAFTAWLEIIFMNNYRLPNYLERLDFHRPYKNQIAEHYFRYNIAAEYCKNKKVLDCACGEGIGVNILKEVAEQVTGLDIDAGTIQRVSRNVKGKNLNFIQGSALELPFPDNSFDVVTSIETIEHIPKKFHKQMLGEFKRVLKSGGHLIVSTPNKSRTSPGRIAPGNYFHLAELTFEELQGLLKQQFSPVKMYGLFNPLREGPLEKIKSDYNPDLAKNIAKQKTGFKKTILHLIPLSIKDILSLIVKGRHIYPQINEFRFSEEDARYASNQMGICIKS